MADENKYKILITAEIKEESLTAMPIKIQKYIDKELKLEINIKNIVISDIAKQNFKDQIDQIIKDSNIQDLLGVQNKQPAQKTPSAPVTQTSKLAEEITNASAAMDKLRVHVGNTTKSANEFKMEIEAAIAAMNGTDVGVTMTTAIENGEEEVKKMVVTYKDLNGQTQSFVYLLREAEDGQKELELATKKYDDAGTKIAANQRAAEKKRLAGLKSEREEIERVIQKAKETEKLTTGKSSYLPEVKAVKETTKAVEDYGNELLAVNQQGIPLTQEQIDKFKNLTNASKTAGSELRALGKNAQSFGVEIGVAIKRTIEWASAMTLIYGTLRQLQAGRDYIVALNKEMTSIQAVTGESKEQINQLSLAYNDLAQQMGATTIEVAKGSLEFLRQGKSVAETKELLKTSLMMSKLAALDSAQATEYVTSIMNGFKLGAEDMNGVLDTLVALDNNYATSVGEIASAMQKSAVSAQQSGISLNELASYITVVSSVSRQSAESIGTSLLDFC
jgi:hypothetical protein